VIGVGAAMDLYNCARSDLYNPARELSNLPPYFNMRIQFFFPLCFQLLSASMVQLKKMAKVQPTLQKFLFESQCEHLQLEFNSGKSSAFLQGVGKVSTEVSNTIIYSTPSSAL
jgi:hypothetical protein